MTEKTVINIDDVPLVDRGNGKQFAVKWGRVGPLVGLNGLGCAVHIVPPGKKAFPFHRHHVQDELFFVVWQLCQCLKRVCRAGFALPRECPGWRDVC